MNTCLASGMNAVESAEKLVYVVNQLTPSVGNLCPFQASGFDSVRMPLILNPLNAFYQTGAASECDTGTSTNSASRLCCCGSNCPTSATSTPFPTASPTSLPTNVPTSIPTASPVVCPCSNFLALCSDGYTTATKEIVASEWTLENPWSKHKIGINGVNLIPGYFVRKPELQGQDCSDGGPATGDKSALSDPAVLEQCFGDLQTCFDTSSASVADPCIDLFKDYTGPLVEECPCWTDSYLNEFFADPVHERVQTTFSANGGVPDEVITYSVFADGISVFSSPRTLGRTRNEIVSGRWRTCWWQFLHRKMQQP